MDTPRARWQNLINLLAVKCMMGKFGKPAGKNGGLNQLQSRKAQ